MAVQIVPQSTDVASASGATSSNAQLLKALKERKALQEMLAGQSGKTGQSQAPAFAPANAGQAAFGYLGVAANALGDRAIVEREKQAQVKQIEAMADALGEAVPELGKLPRSTRIGLIMSDKEIGSKLVQKQFEVSNRKPEYTSVSPGASLVETSPGGSGFRSAAPQGGSPMGSAQPTASRPGAMGGQQAAPPGGPRVVFQGQQARPLTDPAERTQYGVPATERRPVQIKPDGTLHYPDQAQPVESAIEKQRAEGIGKRFTDLANGATDASTDKVMLGRLSQLSRNIEPGSRTATLEWIRQKTGIPLDDNASNVQAFSSALAYQIPKMREAGSGTSSNLDMGKFQQALPSMLGTPEGNQIVIETMGGMANIRERAGLIAQQWQHGRLTAQQADEALQKMWEQDDPFKRYREWEATRNAPEGPAAPGVTPAPGDAGSAPLADPWGIR